MKRAALVVSKGRGKKIKIDFDIVSLIVEWDNAREIVAFVVGCKLILMNLISFPLFLLCFSHAAAWTTIRPMKSHRLDQMRRWGFFDGFKNPLDNLSDPFEQPTSLGKGMTVVNLQVALTTRDRTRSSILGVISEKVRNADVDSTGLFFFPSPNFYS